jgi:hypothetical protein
LNVCGSLLSSSHVRRRSRHAQTANRGTSLRPQDGQGPAPQGNRERAPGKGLDTGTRRGIAVKRDALAPAFGLGNRIGAGQLACKPALSGLHRSHQSALDCSPWQTTSETPRPTAHVSALSSLQGASGSGRGSARHTAGGIGSERAHSRVQLRPARGRANHFASFTASPAVSQPARVGLIEQSTRPGDGFPRPASTRPAGPIPAGVTQGERV